MPSSAGEPHSDRYAGPVQESRRLARALVAGDNLPGVSVAVAVDREIVWAEGFGWAETDSRTPVTPLTRFRLGALSKPLIVAAPVRAGDGAPLLDLRLDSGQRGGRGGGGGAIDPSGGRTEVICLRMRGRAPRSKDEVS